MKESFHCPVLAVTETNDYSSSVSLGTFGHTLCTCAAADEQSRLQFQSPYFSADVCNYSADLSNGSEAADHMTSPSPPCFRRNHSRHQAPLPCYCGEAMIVWIFIYLAPSLLPLDIFIMADI